MGRRSWIKLYTNVVFGSTSKELLPAERWVWIGLLALAGDSFIDGFVCISETIGYTSEQLADILSVDIEILTAALSKMTSTGKISIDAKNKRSILNWKKYQSEYDRQKSYRAKLQPVNARAKLTVEKYLDCGNPRSGFARTRCPDCADERLVMFSCRTRGFCPSCHAKRIEEWGESRDWPGASHSPEDCNHGRVRRKLTPGQSPGPRPLLTDCRILAYTEFSTRA